MSETLWGYILAHPLISTVVVFVVWKLSTLLVGVAIVLWDSLTKDHPKKES